MPQTRRTVPLLGSFFLALTLILVPNMGLQAHSYKVRTAGAYVCSKRKEVEFGDRVKVLARFYVTDFFGKKTISANITKNNASPTTMYCQYYVAFFDERGELVGCSSFGGEIEAGDKIISGSCLIHLPHVEFKGVRSYEVVYYESDAPIGTR